MSRSHSRCLNSTGWPAQHDNPPSAIGVCVSVWGAGATLFIVRLPRQFSWGPHRPPLRATPVQTRLMISPLTTSTDLHQAAAGTQLAGLEMFTWEQTTQQADGAFVYLSQHYKKKVIHSDMCNLNIYRLSLTWDMDTTKYTLVWVTGWMMLFFCSKTTFSFSP